MTKLKYEQIADNLRERISAGEFAPRDRLPSSRELCEQWDVSRATAIKAMEVLRADGVVEARQGSGFTVIENPLARPAGNRHAGTARVSGRPYRRLDVPTMRKPPALVAEALSLPEGDQALHRARLVMADDGGPFSYVTAWFPPDIAEACPRLHHAGPLAEGTTRYVERMTNRAPSRGVDATTIRLATDDEAHHFGTAGSTPVAVVVHTAYDASGAALVCEVGVTPGPLWERIDTYPMGNDI
jgi:DNA-binding GntR family transcriptional regulator